MSQFYSIKMHVMKTLINKLPIYASYAFILLFTYAAVSKMRDFENFQVQLAQSPLLSAYAGFISYGVIILEVMIAGILADPKVRRIGLYASFGLMVAFTVYIYLILNYSDFVPCSCGGILEKMGWTEHLIFNIGCVVIAFVAIVFIGKERAHGWNRIAAAALIAVFSAGSIVALFLSSEYIMKKENNFTRRFIPHGSIIDSSFDLGLNSYYFAGTSENHIFLGNSTTPLVLYSINNEMSGMTKFLVKPDDTSYPFRKLQFRVTPPYYYLFDGSVPVIYRGKLGQTQAKTISYKDSYFNQLIIIDTLRFILRTQSRKDQSYVLADLNLKSLPRLKLNTRILEKQSDGVFDVDGHLLIDNSSKEVVYVYNYRNQFIVTDEDLRQVQRYNTIDSTAVAAVKSKQLPNGTFKMATPPPNVNGKCTVSNGIVFIQSSLRGRLESKKQWQRSFIVDMYSTSSQEYLGSFYIDRPDENDHIRGFLIQKQYLYILIGNHLYKYHFVENIIKKFKKGKPKTL